tara:strand:- start:3793 stop:4995 length:1203 start_codon:yes stop_codon:yes gene_type:complete
MSKTLKRPMFRDGGRANSKGTGIMTGIEDREPYAVGGTTLDPYVLGPLTPPPANREFGFSQKYLSAKPNSPVGRLFRDSGLDDTTASEFLNFIAQTRPEIRKEGSGFSLSPISSAAASELPIITSSLKKTEEEKPEEKPETTKANQPGGTDQLGGTGLEDDEDLDDIKLEDFEEEITRKAELYEKLLAGEGSKKKSIFRALTAAAPGLLEEDYGGAIKAAGEVLGESDDLSRKAKLLAIQEKIAKDAQKTPTKAQEVDILANRYIDNGMNRADAYKAAEKKVYGDEKDSTLPPRDPERYLQDVSLQYLDLAKDDEVIALNPGGFARASILMQAGIPTVTYSQKYDADQEKYVVVKSKSHDEFSPGEYAFDPVEGLFLYKNKKGEKGKASSQSDAVEKSGQ